MNILDYIKKIIIFCLFPCFIIFMGTISINSTLNALDSDDDFSFFDDFDISLDALEDLESSMRSPDPDVAKLNTLGRTFAGKNFPAFPLWKSTKPLESRDVLYYSPYNLKLKDHNSLQIIPFANIATNSTLNAHNLLRLSELNRQTIADLTAISGLVLDKFSSLSHTDTDPDDVANYKTLVNNLDELLNLFNTTTIQERRLGSIIDGCFTNNSAFLQITTSLQFAERNFWITKKVRDQIDALVKKTFISSENPSVDLKNFYRTKGGLGDTRIRTGILAINTPTLNSIPGISLVIPTGSLSLNKSLNTSPDQLVLDVNTLTAAIYNTLYNTRDVLLSPQLGNNGHFNLGIFLENTIKLPQNYGSIFCKLSYDKFFAKNENRLLLPKTTLNTSALNFPTSPAPSDETVVNTWKSIVNQYFLPSVINVSTNPGDIITANISYTLPFKKYSWTAGYDFFARTQESLKIASDPNIALNDYQTSIGQNELRYQHKLFSELSYTKQRTSSNLTVSFGGDYTITANSMSNDWTIFTKIGFAF